WRRHPRGTLDVAWQTPSAAVAARHTFGGVLHHGADLPGRKFSLAKSLHLALRPLAGRHAENHLENPLATAFDRVVAIHDPTAVEVHVLFHSSEQRGVR